MTGEDGFGFKGMVLALSAVALVGGVVTSEASPRFDRITLRGIFLSAPKKKPKPIAPIPVPDPEPVPVPVPVVSDPNPLFTEASFVTSNFDVQSELTPSWGTGAIAPGGEVVGAFRFICNAGQLLKDDPIAFPNQPGKSHLHQFYGNMGANASSTYDSLRQNGSSSCMSPLNRSAYWMPAMLDGVGHVVRPDFISIYYKRRPISDPKCSLTSGDPQAEGNCIGLPNGLRFIFGYNMAKPSETPTGAAYFNCDGPTGTQGHYPTITAAMAYCPTKQNPDGSYNKLGAVINAPSCWDGKNLDSPDHRSHVSYGSYGFWGYFKCPTTHPFVIPTFTMASWFTVDENLGTWRLSSDEMMPGITPGTTFHADWFGAWDNGIEAMWLDNCINKRLSCSGGDLGNGKQMKMYSGFSWTANPRLIPLPS